MKRQLMVLLSAVLLAGGFNLLTTSAVFVWGDWEFWWGSSGDILHNSKVNQSPLALEHLFDISQITRHPH